MLLVQLTEMYTLCFDLESLKHWLDLIHSWYKIISTMDSRYPLSFRKKK